MRVASDPFAQYLPCQSQEQGPGHPGQHTPAPPQSAEMWLTGEPPSLMGQDASQHQRDSTCSPCAINSFHPRSFTLPECKVHTDIGGLLTLTFLASAPWPGCSLIHNQNIKSIVSTFRKTVANLKRHCSQVGGTILSPAENSKTHRLGKGARYILTSTRGLSISQDVSDIPTWQRGKMKTVIWPQKLPQCFSP